MWLSQTQSGHLCYGSQCSCAHTKTSASLKFPKVFGLPALLRGVPRAADSDSLFTDSEQGQMGYHLEVKNSPRAWSLYLAVWHQHATACTS